MISFIPRKDKGGARAGVWAGLQVLVIAFIGIPVFLYFKLVDKLKLYFTPENLYKKGKE